MRPEVGPTAETTVTSVPLPRVRTIPADAPDPTPEEATA